MKHIIWILNFLITSFIASITYFNSTSLESKGSVSDSKRNLSFLTFPAELAGFFKVVEQIDQVSYFD